MRSLLDETMYEKELLHTISEKIEKCYIGLEYSDITIVGKVFQCRIKILGKTIFKWYKYEIDKSLLIKNPKYEREFETNRMIEDTRFRIKYSLECWIYDRRRVL